MRKLKDLRELQKIELDMLLFFDEYCRKKGFRYFLAGGTLLGAVRHKGFIPWDDDVDLAMPRPDYERFLKDAHEWKGRYRLLAPEYEKNCPKVFAKILDTKTSSDAKRFQDVGGYGVFIDVFPLDGLGNDAEEVKRLTKKILFLRGRFDDTTHKYKLYGNPVKRLVKSILRKAQDHQSVYQKLKAVCTKYSFEDSAYVGSIIGGRQGEKEVFPKKVYEKAKEMEFEGHLFMGMEEADAYLSRMYGDYMSLPPAEEQKLRHPSNIWIDE